jgi:hypothetical protein
MCLKLNEDAAKVCMCKFAHLCKRRRNAEVIEVNKEKSPLIYAPVSLKYFDIKSRLHAEKGAHF